MTSDPNDSGASEPSTAGATSYQRIAVSDQNGFCIAKLLDQLLEDPQVVGECRSELMSLVKAGQAVQLIIDFTTVERASPIALSTLMMLQKSVQGNQGRLHICGLNPSMTEVLKVARLDRILSIHNSLADATSSME